MEPRWGVAGPGKACGGARAKADHALEMGVVAGEAYGGREAVGSGGMGRLGGQMGSQGGRRERGRRERGEGRAVLGRGGGGTGGEGERDGEKEGEG